MHLYSTEGKLTKYITIRDILEEYYKKRLELYDTRREFQLDELKKDLDIISNKVRFILMVVNDELIVSKRKKNDIETDLEKHKFSKLGSNASYDYLLSMQIYQLTFEKIEELKKQETQKTQEYDNLYKQKPHDIWRNELIELKDAITKMYTVHKSNDSIIKQKKKK